MNVNVTATMRLTQAALPLIREAEYGSIVNVTSEAGRIRRRPARSIHAADGAADRYG
ncbi:MAG: SDR family NAD(P)-dependent oxidoreductase [Leifsonia sp.]